jgi:hypothetical protein
LGLVLAGGGTAAETYSNQEMNLARGMRQVTGKFSSGVSGAWLGRY